MLGIAWPIGVSMISMTAKQLIDTLMVGSLGTDALAAVGFAGILAFNLFAFPIGVLRGQKSLVSQYQGAGDAKTSISFGAQAFYVAALFALVFVGLFFVAGRLVVPLTAGTDLNAETVGYAGDYLSLRLLWGVPFILSMAVAEYLRATGRTRLPMAADLIAHPLNATFNYLLIFGHLGFPKLGVAGAAIGTGLADTVSLLLLARFITLRGGRPWPWDCLRFSMRRFLRVLSVGSSAGVQFALEIGSFTFVTFFVAKLGTISMAAHQACIAILHVSWLPGVALGDGGGVLIGRYVGRQEWDAVQRTFRSTMSLVMPFMYAMGVCFVIFGEELSSLFLRNNDPEIQLQAIELGASVLIMAALWQIFDAFQVLYRFSLRAAGDHRWVMWVGITCAWGITVPLVWVTVEVFHGDVVAVWAVWAVELLFSTFFFYRRWKKGVWREKRLVRAEDSVDAAPLTPAPSPLDPADSGEFRPTGP